MAQLWWKNLSSSTQINGFTSPQVKVRFHSSRGRKITLQIRSHDSIRGAQYASLPAIETVPDEWHVEVENLDDVRKVVFGSADFVIFPSRAKLFSVRLVSKYFDVVDFCTGSAFSGSQYCVNTSWSISSPDPKSVFPLS